MQAKCLLSQSTVLHSSYYFFSCSAISLSKKAPMHVMNEMKMLSSVTNMPFERKSQETLQAVAKKRQYTRKHWVTIPQARRSCNAVVLPGERCTTVYLHVATVIPVAALPRSEQKRILDEFPPFFGFGVGILSERHKWRSVTAERLIRLLNPKDEERALFIDTDIAQSLEISYNAKDVIDIRSASSISLYNAQQLDDPYKGEPEKGVALNAVTGKRFSQPAHDILLGVGIFRGYTSPMWIAERQLRYLNLTLLPNARNEGVVAPNMTGVITSLSNIPPPLRRDLLKELNQAHPNAFGCDVFYIYNVNKWEPTRSRVLVKNMAAINDKKYPFHFVNLTDLELQRPKCHEFVQNFCKNLKPIGISLLPEPEDANKPKCKKSKNSSSNNSSNSNSISQSHVVMATQEVEGKVFFFAQDATLRRYYNALCMTKPYLAVPAVRAVAFVNGRAVGHRDEALLREFALKHKLSSPLWLSVNTAQKLGVSILPKYQSKYASIGNIAVNSDNNRNNNDDVDNHDNEMVDAEGFYNIDDFPHPENILMLYPKTSKKVHFMLDSKWRPVLGKQRQEFLSSLQRSEPLWVSVNECLMSGFEPKPERRAIKFPLIKSSALRRHATRLYNSQYTSDPVRVIGLFPMLARPQGLRL